MEDDIDLTEQNLQAQDQQGQDQEQPSAGEQDPAAADPAPPLEGEGAKALLDALSEPDPNAKAEEGDAAAAPDPAVEGGKKEEPTDAQDKEKAPAEGTLEQQEAEALEGVKSERGRERI